MEAPQRGNRGGFRGGNRGGPRGGGRGGHNEGRGGHGNQGERKPREAILDLGKFIDKAITVKFNGGREGAFTLFLLRGEIGWGRTNEVLGIVVGTLKGFDQLMNLVLDDVKETLRGMFIREEGNWGLRDGC